MSCCGAAEVKPTGRVELVPMGQGAQTAAQVQCSCGALFWLADPALVYRALREMKAPRA